MSTDEQKAKEMYAKAGVDLPELQDTPKEEPKEPEAEKPKDDPEEPKEPLKEPEEPRKRSIYDEYKDKKSELKVEKEAREQAERERDDLRTKLETLSKADTPKEREDAQDEIDAFLGTHKEWDKKAIKDLVDIARKGVKPEKAEIDESLKKDLEDFKSWKAANAKTVEQQMFNEDFAKIVPTLKESFPTATDEELSAIKKELDTISHTKDWHDKDLDYVAFKHKDELSKLVSPRKRGMESKDRKDVNESNFEFDISADYSKMTPTERQSWEKQYKGLTKTEGLITDGKGRKLII